MGPMDMCVSGEITECHLRSKLLYRVSLNTPLMPLRQMHKFPLHMQHAYTPSDYNKPIVEIKTVTHIVSRLPGLGDSTIYLLTYLLTYLLKMHWV